MADTSLKKDVLGAVDDNTADEKSVELEVISDASVDSFDGPGPLRGSSTLKLETRQGQMIFEGRKADLDNNKSAIIGLKSFASYLRSIWSAAEDNDPYADWHLLKVERVLEEKEEWMQRKTEAYEKLLGQFENMDHEIAHSISPVVRNLQFSIPYSFRGAMLLMKFDALVKTILTANHVGVSDTRSAHKEIGLAGRAVRAAFQTVSGYRFTGVTRKDLYEENKVAQKAAELMGPCPFKILDDEIVPKFESSKSRIYRNMRLVERRKKAVVDESAVQSK